MKLNRIFLLILLLGNTVFNYAFIRPKIYKISGAEFILYSYQDNEIIIKRFNMGKNKLKIINVFKPKFSDSKLIVEGITPTGKRYKSIKYTWLGGYDNILYFQVFKTPYIIEYNMSTNLIKKIIIKYPKITDRVFKINKSLLFCSKLVLQDGTKAICNGKYFVKKTTDLKDEICFCKEGNIMLDMDFPSYYISNDRKLAVIYFSKASKLCSYSTLNGELLKKTKVIREGNYLKNHYGRKEEIYDVKGMTYLLKNMKDKVLIYKLNSKKWKNVQTINGNYFETILLDNHVIMMTEGGKIETKIIL